MAWIHGKEDQWLIRISPRKDVWFFKNLTMGGARINNEKDRLSDGKLMQIEGYRGFRNGKYVCIIKPRRYVKSVIHSVSQRLLF